MPEHRSSQCQIGRGRPGDLLASRAAIAERELPGRRPPTREGAMLQDTEDPKIDPRPGNFLRLFHFYTVNRFHFKRKQPVVRRGSGLIWPSAREQAGSHE